MKSDKFSMKTCIKCKKEKALDCFGVESKRPDGKKGFCKECASILRKRYYKSELSVARTMKWRKKNYAKNLQYMANYRRKLKQQVIDGYGGKCVCCGETEIVFLTLEHLQGDGEKHRGGRNSGSYGAYRDVIKRGFPPECTILCMNCNYAKRGDKQCPHTKKK